MISPDGDQALAQVGSDLYVVDGAVVGGTEPTVTVGDPETRDVPGRASSTDIGGAVPARGARTAKHVHWSIGNAHVVYDLDARDARSTTRCAARIARAVARRRRGGGDSAAARRGGGRGAQPPQFQPRRVPHPHHGAARHPEGTAVLRGARVDHDEGQRGHRERRRRGREQPHRRRRARAAACSA